MLSKKSPTIRIPRTFSVTIKVKLNADFVSSDETKMEKVDHELFSTNSLSSGEHRK